MKLGLKHHGLFKHFANVEMQEIMEEFLPIIYSNSIEYDPLVNVDFTETFERDINNENTNETSLSGTSTNAGTSSSNSTNNSSGLNVSSDTPEGQITKQNILNGSYATSTNASETTSSINDSTSVNNSTTNSNTSNSNGTNATQETYTKHQKGNSGISTTAQALIKQYRDIIFAVDKEIIKRLNTLFMGIY